jgi:hypothetical protein
MSEPILSGREMSYDKDTDTITYEHRYEVKFNDDIATFSGTYTQCLTFIGARTVGKSFIIAHRFAMGTYR